MIALISYTVASSGGPHLLFSMLVLVQEGQNKVLTANIMHVHIIHTAASRSPETSGCTCRAVGVGGWATLHPPDIPCKQMLAVYDICTYSYNL